MRYMSQIQEPVVVAKYMCVAFNLAAIPQTHEPVKTGFGTRSNSSRFASESHVDVAAYETTGA